jgi:hypothetical protein
MILGDVFCLRLVFVHGDMSLGSLVFDGCVRGVHGSFLGSWR